LSSPAPAAPPPANTRRHFGALLLTVALGIISRRVPIGIHVWDKALGDALYAVAVHLVVALLRPQWRSSKVALTAAGLCAAIELFQLTGIPMQYARTPLRWVLGTSFAWEDLLYYAVGIAVVAWVDGQLRRRPGTGAGSR
jgi:hypothetical protein